ncbi:MAG: hypothetical protein GX496_09955 [Firmicutes bacterium]|nr:hypothetical protein [Bacillota bacterium]
MAVQPTGHPARRVPAEATEARDIPPAHPVAETAAHERPRGAMAATLLYLAVIAAAWGYMYFSLLRAAHAMP